MGFRAWGVGGSLQIARPGSLSDFAAQAPCVLFQEAIVPATESRSLGTLRVMLLGNANLS